MVCLQNINDRFSVIHLLAIPDVTALFDLRARLIYIDIEEATSKERNDEFTVRVAETLDEACKLLEVGYP